MLGYLSFYEIYITKNKLLPCILVAVASTVHNLSGFLYISAQAIAFGRASQAIECHTVISLGYRKRFEVSHSLLTNYL